MMTETTLRQSFRKSLIRQRDDYSCGPACLSTIAALHGIGSVKSYDFFRGILQPRPAIGSHPHAMIAAAMENLPCTGAGEGVYEDGLALGYIVYEKNKILPSFLEKATDHYVVFLGKKENKIVYYDPYDDRIYNRGLNKLKWHSTFTWPFIDHTLRHWTVTFETPKGFDFDATAALALSHARG